MDCVKAAYRNVLYHGIDQSACSQTLQRRIRANCRKNEWCYNISDPATNFVAIKPVVLVDYYILKYVYAIDLLVDIFLLKVETRFGGAVRI